MEMNSSVYAFRPAPTYSAANPQDQIDEALAAPLSLTTTLGQQIKQGVLDSYGLGTVLREEMLPPSSPELTPRARLLGQKELPGLMDEESYKQSPYFRQGVQWDRGMTEDRAAALAEAYDVKRVREHFASKRPITAFVGNFAGQAVDPINYIPFAGPAVKGAAAARFGTITGAAVTGALDAAVNTAIASAATYDARRGFGDDITWQSTLSDIAISALIGSAFGGVSGLLESRRLGKLADAQKKATAELATLKNVQDGRAALNDAIVGLMRGDDVSLSANSMDKIQAMAERQNPVWSPDAFASRDRQDLFSSTAVGRVIDTRPIPVQEFETTLRNEVLSSNLDLSTRFKAAEAKFQKAQDAVAAIEEPLAARRQSDSVAMVDPASAERLKAVEDELSGNIPAKRRLALEAERDQIVESVGPEAVAKAENDFRIGPTKQAKQARKALATARQEYSKVTTEVNTKAQSLVAANKLRFQTAIDRTPPAPEPVPTGRVEAETRVAKPADYKQVAEQFRVNPEDGSFVEQAEVEQVRKEGRVTAEDEANLKDADDTFENSKAYGEALRAAVACII